MEWGTTCHRNCGQTVAYRTKFCIDRGITAGDVIDNFFLPAIDKHNVNTLNILVLLGCRDLHQPKARPLLLKTSHCKLLLHLPSVVWLEFQYQIMAHMLTSICRPAFLFDFYRHYGPIWHRLTTMHNAADRAMAICRLCYSIGGLET